jgi:methylglutaconyl-CoA hydratase
MSSDLVSYTLRGSTAILTLERADRRNALSQGLISALDQAVERAGKDPAARSVILTGAGSAFCAGMDLAELQESLGAGAGENQAPAQAERFQDDALRLAKVYDRIYTLPKPTIAAVNGAAVAGGAGLVSVCDLAVAVPEARLGYPEVRRGLVAAMVMPHLMRHVGERMARYLLLTGDLIDANTAFQAGFINAVVPAERLLEQALVWAAACAEGGPIALARTKEFLCWISQQTLSIEEAARASAAPRSSEECRQGLEAFFAKRPAPWVRAGEGRGPGG